VKFQRKFIGLITARSGSKGIKDKNIKDYLGRPLMCHTIEQGLDSKFLNGEVYVSTDSLLYETIATNAGSKSLGPRSSANSQDSSLDLDVMKEFIFNYKETFGTSFDCIVHLRPTYPNRPRAIIDDAIKQFNDVYENYDSLRSMVVASESPFKMWSIENNGSHLNFAHSIGMQLKGATEIHSAPRQSLPTIYFQNACIDIIKCETIENLNSITGKNIFPYLMEDIGIDIDNEDEFYKSMEQSNE